MKATGELPADLIFFQGEDTCRRIKDKAIQLDAKNLLKALSADDYITQECLDKFDEEINGIVRPIQFSVHISCLSDCVDNMLMWSHYADYH